MKGMANNSQGNDIKKDSVERDLYLRKLALGEVKGEITGYPSIDKPWLKYYSEEAINAKLPKCTIYEYLWENNKDNLDDIALNYYNREITYKELFDNINKAVNAFLQLGVKKGDVVTICSVTLPEVIFSFYALNKLGAISNMIDPRTNLERIEQYIQSTNSKLILAIDKCLPKIIKLRECGFDGEIIALSPKTSMRPLIKLGYIFKTRKDHTGLYGCKKWSEFMDIKNHKKFNCSSFEESTVAAIVYTGGTTGVPKGVLLSNETFNIMALQYRFLGVKYTRKDCFLNIMPPFIAYGVVCGIHMPLSLGLTNVIIPQFDPEEFDKLLIKYKPKVMLGVPAHYEKLSHSSKMKNVDLTFFEIPGCGGDGMNEKVESMLNEFLLSHNCKCGIIKGYGMTEVGSAVATCIGNINKMGSVGIPHCKATISIFKPGTDKEIPYNQEGEICLHTPTTMIGYNNNPQETEKVLKIHSDGKCWIHTNDIGYMDEDGFLFIKGRMKRMIIRPDGHNVFPMAIENVILEHDAVENCAVVGMVDKSYTTGKWPVAFVVLKQGYDCNISILKEIEELCSKKLPIRDTAERFFIIEQLPLTDIGKIDYRALEKEAENSREKIAEAELWSKILK